MIRWAEIQIGTWATRLFNLRTVLMAFAMGTFAVLGNLLAYVIAGQINEKAPPEERVSYLAWDLRIRGKHRQLYPESKLVLLFDLCGILLILCFLLTIWSLGIFGNVK